MSERLSDEELAEALAYAHGLHSLRLTAAIAELKERRASAVPTLTEEEREALQRACDILRDSDILEWDALSDKETALAVLDKLLAGTAGGGR